jgi:dTDP-4-amino-4,6-dideoxygalactose transaminase
VIQPVIDRHIENGRFYDQHLSDVPGLMTCTFENGALPSYWLYTVLAERRDGLARRLQEAGVECSLVHRRNDQHSVFGAAKRDLPGLDAYYSRMLHLPCGWWVSNEDREYVVDCIRGGW